MERELRRAGQRWQTWALRAGVAGLTLLIVAAYWVEEGARRANRQEVSGFGAELFLVVLACQATLVLVLAPILGATSMQEEREGRSLELLVATRLHGAQILLGKVLARGAALLSLLFCSTPGLALALSFGGIDPWEAGNLWLQLGTTALLWVAIGAYVGMQSDGPLAAPAAALGWTLLVAPVVSVVAVGIGGTRAMGWVLSLGVVDGSPGMAALLPALSNLGLVGAVLWVGAPTLSDLVQAELIDARGPKRLDRPISEVDRCLGAVVWAAPVLLFLGLTLGLWTKWAPAAVPLTWAPTAGSEWGRLILGWLFCWLVQAWALVVWLLLGRSLERRRAARLLTRRAASPSTPEPSAGLPSAESTGTAGPPLTARPREPGARPPRRHFRQVWRNPVLWREAVTSAHGNLSEGIGRIYILLGVLLLLVFVGLRAQDKADAWVMLGSVAWAWGAVVSSLVATASGIGERRARALDLLRVTPMGAGGIVHGKLGAAGLIAAPALFVAILSIGPALAAIPGFERWGSGDDAHVLGLATWLGLASWALCFPLALSASCLWVGLRLRTSVQAWLAAGVGWCGAILGPFAAAALLHPGDDGPGPLAWLQPLLAWDDDRPWETPLLESSVLWLAVAAACVALARREAGPAR
jgi:ABC-type Na+ efflux pump permease subunit